MFREQVRDITIGYAEEHALEVLWKAIWAIAIFLIIYFVIKKIVRKIENKVKERAISDDEYTNKVANLVWNIVFISLMVFNILIIFSFLKLDVAIVMWSLSIAIGFAMETTIKNMISGILLLTNKKVSIGDFVEVLWEFQLRWTVEEINMRNTIFRTIENRREIIPNWKLADTPIKTLKTEDLIRWELDIKLSRHINLDQVKSLLIQTINNHENIINKNYTSTIVSWFDWHGIKLKSFFYFNPKMWKSVFVIKSDIMKNLSSIFKKYWIKAPYLNLVINAE